jgi:hypothetical protein
VVGGLWVRLGKIKCAAKALDCVSACSSFNFAKGWHFVCHFTARLLSVVSSFRLACNEQVLPMVGNFIFVRPEPLPGFLIKLNIKN